MHSEFEEKRQPKSLIGDMAILQKYTIKPCLISFPCMSLSSRVLSFGTACIVTTAGVKRRVKAIKISLYSAAH